MEITPHSGTPLAGYSIRRGRPFRCVRDRLYARAVVLDNGYERAVIVSVDLLLITKKLYNQIAERVKDITGIDEDHLLIASTHTHSGPGAYDKTLRFLMGEYDRLVFNFLVERISRAIRLANENIMGAKLGLGRGFEYELAVNRDREIGSIDPEIGVIRIDNEAGEPIAIMYNFSVHPISDKSLRVSADFPGYAARVIKQETGAIALYINGAQGDVNPAHLNKRKGFAGAIEMGRKLGEKVADISEDIDTTDEVYLKFERQELILNPTNNYRTSIEALVINDAILLGIPGEMFVELGLKIKKEVRKLGFQYPWIVGLANDHIGYILTKSAYRRHEYEAFLSFFGPDLGDFFVSETIDLAKRLEPDNTISAVK